MSDEARATACGTARLLLATVLLRKYGAAADALVAERDLLPAVVRVS